MRSRVFLLGAANASARDARHCDENDAM
jgi:hypothetical protein